MEKVIRKLEEKSNVCSGALKYMQKFEDGQEHQAWCRCFNGVWMIWFLERTGYDRKILTDLTCQCARMALKHVRVGEERPRSAIELAERWAGGEVISDVDLLEAAEASFAASTVDRASDAACAAASAAAYAAASASASATAAGSPATPEVDESASRAVLFAANAFAYAAYFAGTDHDAARGLVLQHFADIVRSKILNIAEHLKGWLENGKGN
jgi:hypothetical protein